MRYREARPLMPSLSGMGFDSSRHGDYSLAPGPGCVRGSRAGRASTRALHPGRAGPAFYLSRRPAYSDRHHLSRVPLTAACLCRSRRLPCPAVRPGFTPQLGAGGPIRLCWCLRTRQGLSGAQAGVQRFCGQLDQVVAECGQAPVLAFLGRVADAHAVAGCLGSCSPRSELSPELAHAATVTTAGPMRAPDGLTVSAGRRVRHLGARPCRRNARRAQAA